MKRRIAVYLKVGKEAMKISLISPHEDNTLSLPYLPKTGGVSFTVPRLKTYCLAVVQLQ